MLTVQDGAIVRDAVVRAQLGLSMRGMLSEERGFVRPLSPVERTKPDPSATGSPRSSESVPTHCVYCGRRPIVGGSACGFHVDLLQLDEDKA